MHNEVDCEVTYDGHQKKPLKCFLNMFCVNYDDIKIDLVMFGPLCVF